MKKYKIWRIFIPEALFVVLWTWEVNQLCVLPLPIDQSDLKMIR